MGDHVGRLRTVAIAAFIAGLGSLGSSLAPTLPALAALRFATGIGAAGIIPVALAWVGDNTTYEERQATLGRFIGFSLSGQILGPALGGAMAEWLSWRAVFIVFTAAFMVAGVVLFRFDWTQRRNAGPEAQLQSAATPRPKIIAKYLEVLGDSWARTVLWTVGIEGFLFYGAFAYVGVWLRQEFELSYALIGAVLAGFGFGGVIYSLSVRRMIKRLGESAFALIGVSLLLAFFLGVAFVPSWQVIAALAVVAGFGFFMLHNTLQTRATEMYPSGRGTAIAVFAMSLFWGQALGVALFGRAIARVGYAPVFVGAGLALVGLGVVFSRKLRAHYAGS